MTLKFADNIPRLLYRLLYSALFCNLVTAQGWGQGWDQGWDAILTYFSLWVFRSGLDTTLSGLYFCLVQVFCVHLVPRRTVLEADCLLSPRIIKLLLIWIPIYFFWSLVHTTRREACLKVLIILNGKGEIPMKLQMHVDHIVWPIKFRFQFEDFLKG